MIDLHSHILYGLDDGPETLDESLEMCYLASRDGIRTIFATPHVLNGVYQSSRACILERVEELNSALSPNLPLVILPGADVHFDEALFRHVREGRLMTLADNGKYLLVEFPFQGIPHLAERILFELLVNGITPVITHPERNPEIGRDPARYYETIRMGCLGQVTAMSLTGDFGPEVRRLSEKLLIHNLVHIIASDAHSVDRRPPILTPAVKAASKLVGEDEAGKMVTEYPQSILEGVKPNVPEPIPIKA